MERLAGERGAQERTAASLAFRYAASRTLVRSGDVLGGLDRDVTSLGARNVLVVCGHTIGDGSPQLESVVQALPSAEVTVFSDVRVGVPAESVAAAVDVATSAGCDVVVALGGGSAIVTARAMTLPAAVADKTSPGFASLDLPYVVIATTPTTAMARVGAAVQSAAGQRVELHYPQAHAAAVLLDHELLAATPPSVFLDSGVATFCNAAEMFTTPDLPPPARADLREAVDLAAWTLASWAREPAAARDVRGALAVAAFLCGRAADCAVPRQATIGMAMGHGLQGLGTGITHGRAMAAALVGALRYNEQFTSDGQMRLLEVLHPHVAEAESARDACAALLRRVGMPARPHEVGVDPADLIGLVPHLRGSHFVRSNVRDVVSVEEMEREVAHAW